MKVILQMAITANGYIATKDDGTPWSSAEWRNYAKIVRRFRNLVIGKRTFELMNKGDDFKKIGSPFVVVVTGSKKLKHAHGQSVFARSPKEALNVLKAKGFTHALVGGGARLNASFMEAGLVDELYLDVEPLLFGSGLPLFFDASFMSKLRLIGIRKYSKDGIQVYYRVLKS